MVAIISLQNIKLKCTVVDICRAVKYCSTYTVTAPCLPRVVGWSWEESSLLFVSVHTNWDIMSIYVKGMFVFQEKAKPQISVLREETHTSLCLNPS